MGIALDKAPDNRRQSIARLGVGGGNGMGGVCVVCGDGRNNINVWLMGRQLQVEFRGKNR